LDGGYQRTSPGLFPDPLMPLEDGEASLVAGQWRALWADVDLPADTPRGAYPLEITVETSDGEAGAASLTLRVLGRALPPQELLHTEWFHGDCLADFYGTPPRSEGWWRVVENFIGCAARRGVNMILTPLFTPPLDTAVGGERTTVQLVDVVREGGGYRFDFTALERWITLCRRLGIQHFEMAHLFTQWGAAAAPKLMAGREQNFGWHTPATGDAYREFLGAMLPALVGKLRAWGLPGRAVFHISDEPSVEQMEAYRAAKNIVAPLVQGFPLLDALSSYELYRRGAVETPVVALDAVKPFLDHGVPGLWVYYCTGQHLRVSNRFFAMPLARCRVLGVQLYKHNIAGFLHWGFNFYNTGLSRKRVHPFQVTDGGCAFPSGDPFLVYPGPGGQPIESLRLMAMHHALQDLRALRLLEALAGPAAARAVMDQGLRMHLTFTEYPQGAECLWDLRARIHRAIEEPS
jgi:hypothetical protein